jgi:hypothetical protein
MNRNDEQFVATVRHKIAEGVRRLGDTERQWYETLLAGGFLGYPCASEDCVFQRYCLSLVSLPHDMVLRMRQRTLAIMRREGTAWPTTVLATVALPPAGIAFIRHFDLRKYPDLIPTP